VTCHKGNPSYDNAKMSDRNYRSSGSMDSGRADEESEERKAMPSLGINS
jgi:hypothetical protein